MTGTPGVLRHRVILCGNGHPGTPGGAGFCRAAVSGTAGLRTATARKKGKKCVKMITNATENQTT